VRLMEGQVGHQAGRNLHWILHTSLSKDAVKQSSAKQRSTF